MVAAAVVAVSYRCWRCCHYCRWCYKSNPEDNHQIRVYVITTEDRCKPPQVRLTRETPPTRKRVHLNLHRGEGHANFTKENHIGKPLPGRQVWKRCQTFTKEEIMSTPTWEENT